MSIRTFVAVASATLFLTASSLWAQQAAVEQPDEPVVFSVDSVARTAKAVNYRTRGGSTEIIFTPTVDGRNAKGKADVRNRGAAVEIEADFDFLPDPQRFGTEYLTYVLWAISPEGRVSNLGEVQRDKRGRADMNVTSDLQVFGMVVTAEPYFAVRMPSDVIILENEITKKTEGRIFFIDAKYELLKRGTYEPLANPLALTVNTKETPLDVYQARNALTIAVAMGAREYAEDGLKRAEASLEMAGSSVITKGSNKDVITLARQAVQFAEDARALAVERQEIERQVEREAEAAAARQAAAEELRKRQEEEEARRQAELQKAQAEAAQAQAERERLAAERERLEAERKRMEAEVAAAREAQEKAAAQAARLAAERDRERARLAAENSERRRMQAEQEKQELRMRILNQLNEVLPTRDTERGLVVNMGDVLFDIGKFDLRPVAREKLARVAGTVLAFPGLRLRAEGHTDNTGSEEFNQKLSENRAAQVLEYLVSQGISSDTISSEGFSFTRPVADNSTSAGRQANRRVELIISGEVIGTTLGAR